MFISIIQTDFESDLFIKIHMNQRIYLFFCLLIHCLIMVISCLSKLCLNFKKSLFQPGVIANVLPPQEMNCNNQNHAKDLK